MEDGKGRGVFSGGEYKPKTKPDVCVTITGSCYWGHLCHGDTCLYDGQP